MARDKAMQISASPKGVPAGANFALSAKVLKRYLDRHGVVYETRNAGEILSPGNAAQRARGNGLGRMPELSKNERDDRSGRRARPD